MKFTVSWQYFVNSYALEVYTCTKFDNNWKEQNLIDEWRYPFSYSLQLLFYAFSKFSYFCLFKIGNKNLFEKINEFKRSIQGVHPGQAKCETHKWEANNYAKLLPNLKHKITFFLKKKENFLSWGYWPS